MEDFDNNVNYATYKQFALGDENWWISGWCRWGL
jgi:hypothetical protein